MMESIRSFLIGRFIDRHVPLDFFRQRRHHRRESTATGKEITHSWYIRLLQTTTAVMSMFRSKKLDLGGFVNIKVIRDHTKRKVFEQNETERSVGS